MVLSGCVMWTKIQVRLPVLMRPNHSKQLLPSCDPRREQLRCAAVCTVSPRVQTSAGMVTQSKAAAETLQVDTAGQTKC